MTVDAKRYIDMQVREYEHSDTFPEHIVGSYAWHEAFPYETFLLYEYGDLRYPILTEDRRGRALDFGCGPGRMVKRMSNFFGQVDGVDISPRLLQEAQRSVPANTQLWVTNGNDLGDAPKNAYDFIFCTISMQHIAVWDIRMQILRHMKDALKVGGCLTLQMAYHPTYPWMPSSDGTIRPHGRYSLANQGLQSTPSQRFMARRLRKLGLQVVHIKGKFAGMLRSDTDRFDFQLMKFDPLHAQWRENRYDAEKTNGWCDVVITQASLPLVEKDFKSIFGNYKCWWYDVSLVYGDLHGETHIPIYATHWIFLHARKLEG